MTAVIIIQNMLSGKIHGWFLQALNVWRLFKFALISASVICLYESIRRRVLRPTRRGRGGESLARWRLAHNQQIIPLIQILSRAIRARIIRLKSPTVAIEKQLLRVNHIWAGKKRVCRSPGLKRSSDGAAGWVRATRAAAVYGAITWHTTECFTLSS